MKAVNWGGFIDHAFVFTQLKVLLFFSFLFPLLPVLLTNTIDPSNLKGNVIKITDFGLAREIEHTTHMSGAGTYPWMAPEVIKTSDFSKKSDVWRYISLIL